MNWKMSPLTSAILRMTIIMAVATFGNFFLIFVICRGNAVFRQSISPVQLLLLHTCFADLLFALFSLGSEILILSTLPIFYGPDFVCRLVRYVQALPLYASPFLLVAISIDRYQAICKPLIHYTSDRFRRPNCLALSAWALALICSIPQLFIWHKESIPILQNSTVVRNESTVLPRVECRSIFHGGNDPDFRKQGYVCWFSIVAWLLPSMISAIFYFKVCTTVWKSRFWGSAEDNLKGPPVASYKEIPDIVKDASCQLTREYVEGLRKTSTGIRNQISEFDRKRIQTVRLTLCIVFCNFFLWLPFCVINVIHAFAYEWVGKSEEAKVIITQIVILGNLNACVNPWIYILFNRKIMKRALSSIIRENDSASASGTRQTQSSLGYRLTINSHH